VAVLFIIGGVVPLLRQAGLLPTFLLIASGWEIFLQNVSLALVITWLLGNTRSSEHSQDPKMGSRADQTAPARAGN
jgi:hypothetical protein